MPVVPTSTTGVPIRYWTGRMASASTGAANQGVDGRGPCLTSTGSSCTNVPAAVMMTDGYLDPEKGYGRQGSLCSVRVGRQGEQLPVD